ncbi:hypothetical protein [Brachyspira hyodysenteriae]|nr:hypothetical protein [Brachyspira hyodysenteriae]MDA0058808.1 hypothetical protein [Brachyspira hyodysenteriae]
MYTYNQYIDDVINKKLPVCSAAFLAVKRHLYFHLSPKADRCHG